jgi:hypothetical protein
MLRGSAEVKLGSWFKASGYLAVFVAILLVLLNAMGLHKINTSGQLFELPLYSQILLPGRA